MRLAVSAAFDLNMEDSKHLKEVVKEVFQSKPRGRAKEDRRRPTKRQKVVTMF